MSGSEEKDFSYSVATTTSNNTQRNLPKWEIWWKRWSSFYEIYLTSVTVWSVVWSLSFKCKPYSCDVAVKRVGEKTCIGGQVKNVYHCNLLHFVVVEKLATATSVTHKYIINLSKIPCFVDNSCHQKIGYQYK